MRAERAAGRIWLGRICASFQRAPVDDRSGSSLGAIPVERSRGFRRALDRGWQRDAFLLHIPEGETMWLGLAASTAGPTAIRVRWGDADAISGGRWSEGGVRASPRNYVVWPGQLRVEGIYRAGRLRSPFSLEGDAWRPLELWTFGSAAGQRALRPRRGPGARPWVQHGADGRPGRPEPPANTIAPDPLGAHRWRATPTARVLVYVTSPALYADITGLEPLSPVSDQERYGGWRLP